MFEKRTWKAREVQYPGKRILTDAETGDTSSVFVTRDEGTVTEMGDSFSAANMNDLEQRISGGFADAASFSETPELTGGTWFDGKPIWRVSKYYSNVTFSGVGQWTAVGALPLQFMTDQARYKMVDVDMRIGHVTNGGYPEFYRLPIWGSNGIISDYVMGEDATGDTLNFRWVGTNSAPFGSKLDVLLTVYYTIKE